MGKEISLSSIEEQLEEAQDLVILADSVSSASFIGTEEELDPITQAIRQEILQKQHNILKEYITSKGLEELESIIEMCVVIKN